MLLLALALVVSFVPLYFAVATYTETAHSVLQRQQALELTAGLANAIRHREQVSEEDLVGLLGGRIVALQIAALQTGDQGDATQQRAGSSGVRRVAVSPEFDYRDLPEVRAGQPPALVTLQLGTWVGVTLAEHRTLSAFIVHQPTIWERLNGLLLAYMVITGFVLLLGVYFLVTQRIIRPLDELSHAARRVTSTDRPLTLPHPRSREFEELNQSLQSMTDKLLREEAALRQQITEVETRTQQLRSAQAQLIRSERLASVGQLAAGVAHEIGNPIAALLGLQDLILQGGLTPAEQEEFVRRMRKETERIHRIVRDLLHFARSKPSPTSGPASANVHHALTETLGLLEPQPAFRELTVVAPTNADVPDVAASHELLVQVFLNLLLNAANACPPTGTVAIETRRWRAPEDDTALYVEIVVQDDGPGVPPELRDTLFEPFVSGKDVGEGTGLGLSVCRNLVEDVATESGLPHVTIELDQAFTSGARFVMRLPISSHTT